MKVYFKLGAAQARTILAIGEQLESTMTVANLVDDIMEKHGFDDSQEEAVSRAVHRTMIKLETLRMAKNDFNQRTNHSTWQATRLNEWPDMIERAKRVLEGSKVGKL